MLLSLCLAAPAALPLPLPQALAAAPKPYQPPAPSFGSGCDQFPSTLCVPLDASFTRVQFNMGVNCDRNDDGSAQLSIPGWAFDFFGTAWSDLYVNNNGNVSFGFPFAAYSSSGFPINGFPMIAPFWGDVDTRGDSGTDGVVWYRAWSTAAGDAVNRFVVTWDHVGFYNSNTSLLDTFQLILTDGNDPLIGIGNNVCFCYDDMQWTTGDASSGTGGFGGTPATVGANQGNGTDFFLIGRFDAPGTAYDGPGGANDGVDYLDGQHISFSVAGGATNVPPVFVGAQTRHVVAAGQTLQFDVDAIGPEAGQTVTMVDDGAGLAGFSSSATPGNPARSSVTFQPTPSQLGTHVVRFTATDDGVPPAAANLVVEILVVPAATLGSVECDPNAPNSTGRPGLLFALGSDVAADNQLTLEFADLPPGAFGLIAVGRSSGILSMFGGSQGTFCLDGNDIGRYGQFVFNAGTDGRWTQALDLTAIPTPAGVPVPALAGQTWGWQLWYRDQNPGPVSNFTNAVRVTFQ